MKIDVTQQLTELDGEPMVTGRRLCPTCGQTVGEIEPMTVRLAATRALSLTFKGEENLPGDEKVAQFHLALKITDEDEPDLRVEDVALVKERVGKMYGQVIVGRMWAILDPPAEGRSEV